MRNNERAKTGGRVPPSEKPQTGFIGTCTAALGRMAATLREFGSARAPRVASIEKPSLRMSETPRTAPHLSKLNTVVESAAQHVERAEQCHRGAGIRIDAALYELEQLRMELESVVDPALLHGTSRILEVSAKEKTRVTTPTEPAGLPIKAARAGSARSAA